MNSIVLVETPKCFVNLKEILIKYQNSINAVGFGSHDFCTLMGMKHNLNNLIHFKNELILLTKAFGVKYIDTVDLNLSDFTEFKKECLFAFENGADGKFIIHPKQLEQLNKVEYLTSNEIETIRNKYEFIKDLDEDTIDIFKIGEEILEKPHINRINQLYQKLKKYDGSK